MDGTERWFDRLSQGLWKGVRRVSGAGAHRYRGFRYLRPSDDGIAALAGWDGTLGIHRGVPTLLDRLFRERGRGWSERDLVEAVSMLGTLIHEAFHHVVPRSADVGADIRAYRTFLGEALEEGVTEAATQRMLPRVVRGMERSVPGLTRGLRSREGWAYPNYVPAIREMVDQIQALPGMRGRDVLMELAREGPATKLHTLTRLYLEGRGLDGRFSAQGREECWLRMGEALRTLYEAPETRAWAEPPDRKYPGRLRTEHASGRSRILGMQAVMELELQSLMALEREGVPMTQNWRVMMAERMVEAARHAVDWSELRDSETQESAEAWLRDATEDLNLAHLDAPAKPSAMPHTSERRSALWIDHWRRSRQSPRRPRQMLQQAPGRRRELG